MPLDRAGASTGLPAVVLAAQPPGSFVLTNRTNQAVTAIVVQWSYVQTDGEIVKRGINCDGYVYSPLWRIAKPKDMALITPEGCTPHENFAQVGTIHSGVNDPVPPRDTIRRIELTVDSVIFEDGQIWGPDKSLYYKKIWERYNAAQSFVSELVAAKNAGEEIAPHLARMRREAAAAGDRQSSWKGHYAALLQRSPNPEGTLQQLQEQAQPPDFRHIGEQQ